MALTTYGASGVSPRTNVYAEAQMLMHTLPTVILEKTGKPYRMPKNKTAVVKFRRPVVFTAATTPLVEGVTPTSTAFTYEDVTATLGQYGMVVEITDKIEDLHEDPVLNDAAEQAGENIGRTQEALNYAVTKAGTSVYYANGALRTAVNTAISLNKQRAVVRALKGQKAKKIRTMLSSSPNYATKAVEAAFIGVCHTDCEADIRGLPGFTPVSQYGQVKPICAEEFGTVEDVRYLCSPDLDPFADAGGAKGSMVSTTGTSADVYPILYFGQEAWAHVALRGQGAISPTIIPPGQKTKDDPLGQRGVIGWKMWHTAVILNDLWMSRLEVAVTDLG